MSRDNSRSQRKEKEFEYGNVVVYVDDMSQFEKCIRKFKKLLKKSGVIEEYIEKQTYEKPSDKKRRIKNRQKRRQGKEPKQNDDFE